MRRAPKIVTRFVSLLLAAALALSPVAAFAAPAKHQAQTAAHESAPCDMPCDGCDDGKSLQSCAVACAAVVVWMHVTPAPAQPAIPAARIAAPLKVAAAGRAREPDKPPPRPVLA